MKKLRKSILVDYSVMNFIELTETNTSGSNFHFKMVTFLYDKLAPGAMNLRTSCILKSIANIETAIRNVFKMDLQTLTELDASNDPKLKLNKWFRIFLKDFLIFKQRYTFEPSIVDVATWDTNVIFSNVIEETRLRKIHIGQVLRKIIPKTDMLVKKDLKLICCALKIKSNKRRFMTSFKMFQISKHHFDVHNLLKKLANVIAELPRTYCRFCYKPKSGHTTIEAIDKEFEKTHYCEPIGKQIKYSCNIIQKLMEANHFARLSVEDSFLRYDARRSGTCTSTQFVEGCSRVLNILKKRISLDTSISDLVTLLRLYELPDSAMASWKNFHIDISCGCEVSSKTTLVYYTLGEEKVFQDPPEGSAEGESEEEGRIIYCDEEEESRTDNEYALNQGSLYETVVKLNPRSHWRNSTIEEVGSVPCTSASWERYCEKFISSSEESFSNLKGEVCAIPLLRKIGYMDVTKVESESNESIPKATNSGVKTECKYTKREQYQLIDLVPMSEALIKFKQRLSTLVGDCISYVRCLDPDQTGYISFQEFIEVLVTFNMSIDDESIFELEDWFCTSEGLHYRSLMEALYELNEVQEDMECECNVSDEETSTTYQEEKQSQDMTLKNVMQQYEEMTSNALMRIRAAVFEQGILMMDIFKAHDVNGAGWCTRQQFFNIASMLINLSEEIWTLIMYKYCRPFEPNVMLYRPFADDIDCNAQEPNDMLLPRKYLNETHHHPVDRKNLTWIIERIGRTCTLDQIRQLFCGATSHPERLLNEEQFLSAMEHIRFITISEKEMLYKAFLVRRSSVALFEYERFRKCCRFVHMMFYTGTNDYQEN